jgi:hypothetical protein
LGYNNQHKGYKCLEPSSYRVYISHDVIFDETVFPFSTLHPNTVAHLQAEILLLHPRLCNAHEGERVEEPNVSNATDTMVESFVDTCALGAEDGATDGEILAPGLAGAPTYDINCQQPDAITTEDLSIEIRGDCLSRKGSSDRERILVISDREQIPVVSDREHISAKSVPRASVGVTSPHLMGSSMVVEDHGVPTGSTNEAAQSSVVSVPFDLVSSMPDDARLRTRLQNNIKKPKVYTDGTI